MWLKTWKREHLYFKDGPSILVINFERIEKIKNERKNLCLRVFQRHNEVNKLWYKAWKTKCLKIPPVQREIIDQIALADKMYFRGPFFIEDDMI